MTDDQTYRDEPAPGFPLAPDKAAPRSDTTLIANDFLGFESATYGAATEMPEDMRQTIYIAFMAGARSYQRLMNHAADVHQELGVLMIMSAEEELARFVAQVHAAGQSRD